MVYKRLPGQLKDFSPEQIFFLSYAQVKSLQFINLVVNYSNYFQGYCESSSDSIISEEINKDIHPANQYRVFGTLSNYEEFSKAFRCPVGSKMNPTKKCRVW